MYDTKPSNKCNQSLFHAFNLLYTSFMQLIDWCNRLIKYSFYLLFILVPLILTPWNYELFEFNKMIVTYALTILIVTAWVVKMTTTRTLSIRRTPLDIPIVLFVISQLVSSLFSMDPHVSWFGYYSRFNGGMLSIFCYVLLYYAFVSNWEEDIKKLLYVVLGTGVAVATYGVLERLGIDKNLWVQDVQNRVFSTLGQPNWLAAYLVALMPVSLALALQAKTFKQRFVIFSSIYILFYVTLLFTRSRSGMLAYGASIGIFSLLSFIYEWLHHKKTLTLFVGQLVVIHAIILGITFFNGSNIDQIDKYFSYAAVQQKLSSQQSAVSNQPTAEPQKSGTLLEYGGTESGTIRKYVWEAALIAWKSTQKTFFIGTGTETFAFAFFQFKPTAHNLTSEWDFLYNKAHNEYLNYLATTGIFGLGSYLFVLGLFILWFLKSFQHSDTQNLSSALFAGWISILITNFFGFSVVIVQILLFMLPALIILINHASKKEFSISVPLKVARSISVIVVGLGTIGVCYVGVLWMGDYLFAMGYRQSRSGQFAESYKNLTQATYFRPSEPLYYDELSVVLGSLAVASLEVGNATAASELGQQSLIASDVALATSPMNVNFWKSRTKIYFGFSGIDSKFVDAAKESLEKAYALSPNDPKITYNLAVLEGRLGNNEKAIDILKKTIAMKPNYRDAYFALNVFYEEVNQPELAKSVLQEYLKKVDPNDQEFLEKVK